MRTFDRDATLADVATDPDWKSIRKWIAAMVQLEPKVMREVSNARFGDLGSWLENRGGNVGYCGCLVGTTALKLIEDRNHFKPFESLFGSVSLAVDLLVKEKRDEMVRGTENAGIATAGLAQRLGNDDAVALIKSEIRTQLLLRARHMRGGRVRAKSAKRKSDGTFAKVG